MVNSPFGIKPKPGDMTFKTKKGHAPKTWAWNQSNNLGALYIRNQSVHEVSYSLTKDGPKIKSKEKIDFVKIHGKEKFSKYIFKSYDNPKTYKEKKLPKPIKTSIWFHLTEFALPVVTKSYKVIFDIQHKKNPFYKDDVHLKVKKCDSLYPKKISS